MEIADKRVYLRYNIAMTKYTAIIVPSEDAPEDTMSGRSTIAKKQRSLSGDYVEKRPNPYGVFAAEPDLWLEIMQDARNVSEKIRAKKNPAYFVPKTFISHNKVREQFARGAHAAGKPLPEWAVAAVGNFINDMSELAPVQKSDRPNMLRGAGASNKTELAKWMDSLGNLISSDDAKFILDAYEYLRTRDENQTIVLCHADLHGGNIHIDQDTKTVSILDFEMVRMCSQLEIMYARNITARKDVWDCINTLPRATNPKLRWRFDENVHGLYTYMTRIISRIRTRYNINIKNTENDDRTALYISRKVAAARTFMDKIKASESRAPAPLAQNALVAISAREKN